MRMYVQVIVKWGLLVFLFFGQSLAQGQDSLLATAKKEITQVTKYSDSIRVYVFLLDECRISQFYTPMLNQLYDNFHADRINFIGVFPNRSSSIENINKFKEEYKLKFELVTDYDKKLVQQCGVHIMPEVAVYDLKNQQVLYRGRIDNQYASVGVQRRIVTSFELHDVLTDIVNNQTILTPNTESIGCIINKE